MPAYNFKHEFADAVESGEKKCTIRKKRKRRTVVGDRLYLYTGMRTKACRKLREDICSSVHSLTIRESGIWLDGVQMLGWELDAIAADDGFESVEEMRSFFRTTYGCLPFEGVMIFWD